MKICGYMSFFDESPHWLATAVAGMARLCDVIVAHDGAYALYPGARARSHPHQSEAVLGAAEAADVACLLYQPRDVYWGNEIEKRNQGLRFAGALLEPDEDWLLVFDADFHVLRVNPEVIRHELGETELDVATYTILDGKDLMADPGMERAAKEMDISTEWTTRTRDIYRWTPSLTIGPTHYGYSRWDNGKRRWLRGPWEGVEDAHELEANLVVYHRREDRAKVRLAGADGYRINRQNAGIEKIEEMVP